MAVKLNKRAYEHAKKLIEDRKVVLDPKGAWSDHQPSTREKNRFLKTQGLGEYEEWYLGIDTEEKPESKRRYKFPYGDFENVHRCGVLSAESRAGQYKHHDIELAAAHLHGNLDEIK